MGTSKSQLFELQDNQLANLAKALGHPARVAIIRYLLKNKSCICNDLVNELPLSQSTITQHLRELKEVGLIKGEVEGPKMNYCINEEVWQEAGQMFSSLFAAYVPKQNCC